MDIRQLEYFVAAAENLSFSRAAAKCCVVQPTISHQIANLEEELGVQLFERNRRTMRLTAAGELMLSEARELVAAANDIIRKIDALKAGERNSLRVGYYSICIDPVLGSRVYEFAKKRNIDVKLEYLDFYQGVFFEKLIDRQFDLVLTLGDVYELLGNDSATQYVPLFNTEVKLVVSAGHPLAGLTEITKEQLNNLNERFLIYAPSYDRNVRERGKLWNQMALDIPAERFEVAKSLLEMQLEIEAGNAVGFMTDTEICSLNAYNRVSAISVIDSKQQEVGSCYLRGNSSPLIAEFIAHIRSISM